MDHKQATRVPAVPLITSDPYFSLWSPSDVLYESDAMHWTGKPKPVTGWATIDGSEYTFMGLRDGAAMEQVSLDVRPTASVYTFRAMGVSLEVSFRTPLLLDDLDLVSRPCSYIDFSAHSLDGAAHHIELGMRFDAALCHDEPQTPDMLGGELCTDEARMVWMGKARQALLSHSGDGVSIDWGHLYLALPADAQGSLECSEATDALSMQISLNVCCSSNASAYLIVAYDDIASIFYFGRVCPGYWARDGKTIVEAIGESMRDHTALCARCDAFDKELSGRAAAIHPDYESICNLAYRQAIAAHKLISDERGEPVFLSKENYSNGCIGTVDLTYPSAPLFLLYNPALVEAMMRPVLRFARMPIWPFDFAPHDVGRYPYASGQVYGLKPNHAACPKQGIGSENGPQFPLYYLMPSGTDVYDEIYQMPVEESANLLILAAALVREMGARGEAFACENMDLYGQWVRYLLREGADPGDQLCTDDFAGHLAHNVNLACKAVMGIYAYSELLRAQGSTEADDYAARARDMARDVLERAQSTNHTRLAFDCEDSWSLKYNTVWDVVWRAELWPDSFYKAELDWYRLVAGKYGVALDLREDYTKSDWEMWCAAMADDPRNAAFLYERLACFLRETPNRVPFSDWFHVNTGVQVGFQNRSVQGGLFMPLYRQHAK